MNNTLQVEALVEIIKEEVPDATVVLRPASISYGPAIDIELNDIWVGLVSLQDGVVKYDSYKIHRQFVCELADPECFTRLGEAIRQSISWYSEAIKLRATS